MNKIVNTLSVKKTQNGLNFNHAGERTSLIGHVSDVKNRLEKRANWALDPLLDVFDQLHL